MSAGRAVRKVLLALACACSLPLFSSCTAQAFAQGRRTRPAQGVQEGDRAPRIAGTDFDGRPLRLSDDRGQVVLLNFWASWCSSCLEEMPTLLQWQKELGPRGLRIVSLSLDDEKPSAARVVSKFGLTYPVMMATAALAERYGVQALPASFLIDRQGMVTSVYLGEMPMPQVHRRLEQLLDGSTRTVPPR